MTITEIEEVAGIPAETMRWWIRKHNVVPVQRIAGIPASRMQIKKEDFLQFAEHRLGIQGEELAQLRERVEALPPRPRRAPRAPRMQTDRS